MNIIEYAAQDSAELILKDAHGNELKDDSGPVSVTLCSPATEQYKRAQAAHAERIKEAGEDDSKLADSNALFCAECTLESKNLEYPEGLFSSCLEKIRANYPDYPFPESIDKKALICAYADPKLLFIRNQVMGALVSWGKFAKSVKDA